MSTMSTAPLRFDGRVVLVTGAGNGLGRAYALGFAARGASVVVNDLGGSGSGKGATTRAADSVVDEIKAKGGIAVANYDSVENGEKVVQTALDSFGRVDVVVNNAGILRDRSFARISDEDWDLIQRVHLKGTFMVSRAAWPHMRKQNYGRIITVTSTSGIYGNFGQANYSAAKLGILGLNNTLAKEGIKYNIRCNCIAPTAGSRLTETIWSKELVEALKPEFVSPLVEFLGHESCEETGSLFEVGAGWIGKLRWHRNEGALLREWNSTITAEKVRDNWNIVTDFSSNKHSVGVRNLLELDKRLREEEEQAKQINVNDRAAQAKAAKLRPMQYTYTDRDTMLYALSVGVSTTHKDYLRLLFELSDDFQVLPTFAVIPALECTARGIPGVKLNVPKVLHGEQYLELYKPIPKSGTLTMKWCVADVIDKKSGTLFIYNVETFDEKDEKVAFNQFMFFEVGSGNWGGPTSSTEIKPLAEPPSRPPDRIARDKTSVDQAALYRLTGDRNPLHIDPKFAAKGGLKQPILHGLCSFGSAVRHVLMTYADNDMSLFKAAKVRFAKPVIPGDTLQTEMWREGNRIFFQTKICETNTVVISGAYVDLHSVVVPSESVDSAQPSNLKSSAFFKQMASQPNQIRGKVDGIFLWDITQGGKKAASWVMDATTGEVYEGNLRTGEPDCVLTLSDDCVVDLMSGRLDSQKAFMTGDLKFSGNFILAQKLWGLFPSNKAKI